MYEWIRRRMYYWRCELIYFLGGTPNEHINTINYKNVEALVARLKTTIEEANSLSI